MVPGGDDLIARFSWVDYVTLLAMLIVSALIGVYHGFYKKPKNVEDYFVAGKSMSVFPIAMSLIASFMSAIGLLGIPSEMYTNGLSFWMTSLGIFPAILVAIYLYLPVFWELQLTSSFAYLEHRFNSVLRIAVCCTEIVWLLIYMAVVVYAPALALSQVTGLNLYMSVTVLCVICGFYSTIGGMKAVIWTDFIQLLAMYGSMGLVIVKGTIDMGGFSYVWKRSQESGRLEWVNWDLDPTARHGVLAMVIGGTFKWINIYGTTQAQVQRYVCLKKRSRAVAAMWMNAVGVALLILMCCYCGLLAYSKYWDCDPVSSGRATKTDQLLPLFVMDVLGYWKGFPGIFVAGVFAASLSTISTGMNSIAAVIMEDFVKKLCSAELTERRAVVLSKVFTLILGVVCFGLVFVVQNMGSMLSAVITIAGVLGGPRFGVFSLGILFPCANKWGATFGYGLSVALMVWIGIGQQIAAGSGFTTMPPKPVSVDGCFNGNVTLITPATISGDGVLWMYKVSYFYLAMMGCLSTIFLGLAVSVLTGGQDLKQIDPRTITPLVFRLQWLIPSLKDVGKDFDAEKLNHEAVGAPRNHTECDGRTSLGLENIAFDHK